MSKMSTERARIALNGPAMGTRWSALFFDFKSTSPNFDIGAKSATSIQNQRTAPTSANTCPDPIVSQHLNSIRKALGGRANPIEFKGYTLGAELAEINSDATDSNNYKFNHTFFEVYENKIKLKDQYFYDPGRKIVSNTNGQYLEKNALEDIFIHSFSSNSKVPNYIEQISAGPEIIEQFTKAF